MKARIRILQLVSILFISSVCYSQTPNDTLRVLFVGNSYTYFENLAQMVSVISDDTPTKLITKKSVVGGGKLSEHWQDKRGLKTREIIKNGNFDIVVLQDHSMGAIHEPDSLLIYAKLLCDFIKENGAKPYLYLTWAREKVPQYQNQINEMYERVAAENNALLVPVGKAWELAMQLRPKIELFDVDGSHPNKLGTFLTACTFVNSLSGEIPDELGPTFTIDDKDGEWIYLMRLDPLDIIFCKKVVEQATRKP